MTISRLITVKHATWIHKHTRQREDVITIEAGNRQIKIPYDVARQVVDQVHDLCDARDTELREASHE